MAQYEDLEIDQGTDVAIQIELDTFAGTNKDLTNHSAQAKMKRGYNSDSANTQDFNTIINTPPSSGIITLFNKYSDKRPSSRKVCLRCRNRFHRQ